MYKPFVNNIISSFIGLILMIVLMAGSAVNNTAEAEDPPIYIAFHWHMHQPIYWPYESIVETEARGAYSYSLRDEVMLPRTGPYTNWPADAVQRGINANMENFGAQVSFSGSLVENIEAAQQAGWGFEDWQDPWHDIISQQTAEGNPRIDMTGFGYHHPLMPLVDNDDIRRQIRWHREQYEAYFPGEYSKGIFPPETAFSPRIIPALKDEGFDWVMIDNLHFERTAENAPTGDDTGVQRPNRADVRNPDPGDWSHLDGVYNPAPVSKQWAHQPRYVKYTDPQTGQTEQMIGVPASRYLGDEDGRGGFGALDMDEVMPQFEDANTDPDQPILLLLHHDGDNHGGGTDAYYNHNFEQMIEWLEEYPDRFQVTTVQDYLDKYPPDPSDAVHVQDGSWLGADAGDPEFKKWLGDPGEFEGADEPYSPNRNAWGIMTAAQNIVRTAEQVNPDHSDTESAWEYYLNGISSDYWYWDGTEMWDSHPARAANKAVEKAKPIAESGANETPPSIFVPQRDPYNPGSIEWDEQGVMPSDFEVWTYVFDMAGLDEVNLKYRTSDSDEITDANLIYDGGASVGEWESAAMEGEMITSITDPMPEYKAEEFTAELTGLEEQMVDFYVEATDSEGNTAKSVIQHVWVGDGEGAQQPGPGPDDQITWTPEEPEAGEEITIVIDEPHTDATLHWGVNDWTEPVEAYHPEGTESFDDGEAVQSPMTMEEDSAHITIGPFEDDSQPVENISFVISYDDGEWDNNDGQDYYIYLDEVVSSPEETDVPDELALEQNYPNPFNPDTEIRFALPEEGQVELDVYDVTGRRVARVVEGRYAPGMHTVRFDGSQLSSGVYLYRLTHGQEVQTRQMMLMK